MVLAPCDLLVKPGGYASCHPCHGRRFGGWWRHFNVGALEHGNPRRLSVVSFTHSGGCESRGGKPSNLSQLQRDLAAAGPAAIFKGLRTAVRTLGAHLAKLDGIQYESQVRGTIQNVSNQIVTILQFIKDNGLKP